MRNLRLAAVLLFASSVFAQVDSAVLQDAQTITGRALIGGHTYQYLQQMTDRFGPRLTGTENYNQAADWAAEQFRAMGIKDVRLEPFTLQNSWQRGNSSGRILSPVQRPLHIEPLGWTPSTPSGGIHGQVYVLRDISEQGIHARAYDIKGKVILLDVNAAFAGANQYKGWTAFENMPALLRDAGAQGVLLGFSRPEEVISTTSVNWAGRMEALPMASIGLEDNALLMRVAEQGPANVEYEYTVRSGGAVTANDVVAEIRGTEKPDEWIILGAHLDSWDFATGAQDNGSGVVQVLEAARILSSLGHAPKRSIRFALWGGEEEGLIGSRTYVHNHLKELDHCIAVLNTDNGAGHPQGWKVQGRDDVSQFLRTLTEPLLAPLGATDISKKITFDTDHGFFMLQGIPSLDMEVDMKSYDEIHHTVGDTLDKVDSHPLQDGTALLAVTAWAIAQNPQRVGPRLSQKDVDKLIAPDGLSEYVRHLGEWK
jgi:carboxypeptidase Q